MKLRTSGSLTCMNVSDISSVLQVRLHPRVSGPPGGPVAGEPGGRAAVAPAALLVHSDLQRSSEAARSTTLSLTVSDVQQRLHASSGGRTERRTLTTTKKKKKKKKNDVRTGSEPAGRGRSGDERLQTDRKKKKR